MTVVYDYIVVGSGSGGGALTARLSEDPSTEVLVIEAGPDYGDYDKIPLDLLDASEVSVNDHDWGLKAHYLEPVGTRDEQPYPRGRVVGGSSAVNAAVANRATQEDFDHWVTLGNERWGYEATLPYFQRLESDLDFGSEHGHGSSGPIPIRRYPREQWAAAVQAFVDHCVAVGHPYCSDLNSQGSTGVGPVPRNLVDDDRASSLITYLAEARKRPNVTILPDSTCRRVLFEGNRAVGVEIEDQEGNVLEHRADRVVLSAGAIHTPQILTLSGIGPQEVLDRLAIAPVAISEGVGRGFQDHLFAPVMCLLKTQTPFAGVRAMLKYTSSDALRPDDMMIFAPIMDPDNLNFPGFDLAGKSVLTFLSLMAKPQSTGWLEILSKDVHVQPEIHANFYEDRGDLKAMMEGIRKIWSMVTSEPVADQIEGIVTPTAEVVEDDALLEQYLRDVSTTSYHATSTCRMGPDGDPMSVVDQDLRVRGVDNLWVADASVFPRVPTGLTNVTSYMVGERAADILSGALKGASA